VLNLGWDVADRVLPYLWFDTAQPEDMKAKAETFGVLVEKVGLRVPASHVRELFGIPAPVDDEEVVGRQAAPADNGALPMKARRPASAQPNKAGDGRPADAGQAHVDELVAATVEEGRPVVEKTIDDLVAIVESASDYDDLRDKILAAYADQGDQALQDLLARAMFMAEQGGRHA